MNKKVVAIKRPVQMDLFTWAEKNSEYKKLMDYKAWSIDALEKYLGLRGVLFQNDGLSMSEIQFIMNKLNNRLIDVMQIINDYESYKSVDGILDGRCLDESDLHELSQEVDGLNRKIKEFTQELSVHYTNKHIRIILNREESLSDASAGPLVEGPRVIGRSNIRTGASGVDLINFDYEKRSAIAASYEQQQPSSRHEILGLNGEKLSYSDQVGALLKHTYYLETDSGLRPFASLVDVADFLSSKPLSDWTSVVKFRITPEYTRKNNTEVVSSSISVFPIVMIPRELIE